VDLSSLQYEFNFKEFRASKFDGHPSAKVHRKIAKILGKNIVQNILVQKSFFCRKMPLSRVGR